MARLIILLSGPIASGKSTVSEDLERRFGVERIKTRELIRRRRPGVGDTRLALQRAGNSLDRETQGRWVAEELEALVRRLGADTSVLVDSVRVPDQIVAVRRSFGPQVVHIHLTAPEEELARRYEARKRPGDPADYAAARREKTERLVGELEADADVVIDTFRCRREDILVRVAAHLGFYGRSYEPLVDVLVGGQWGSEGKGQIVSYLAPEYDYLVRVGGPNAGHTVYEEPEPYKFHVLPSGTRHSEAGLIIGPGAVIALDRLQKEIAECEVSVDRLAIDPAAMIIEPDDVDWETSNLKDVIGSTAQGVGRATARRILDRKPGAVRLARDVPELAPYRRSTRDVLDAAFRAGKRVLLEGTQGSGLSLYHGDYPYVTSRDTTVGGCLAEAGIAPSRIRKIVMVCRTYPIRVQSPKDGSSGGMGTEIDWTDVADRSGLPLEEIRTIEKTTTTRRDRRVAEFNWHLLRTAASLNAPTDIALTFADYIHADNRKARRFEQLTTETIRMIQEMERVAAAPVSLIVTNFGPRSIIDRRAW